MSDLDAIRDRIDIVELVGETVRLQKSGRNYKGLCPFHTEKTPSFTVSPERRSWHCFGSCSTGGDVFSFIMRRDNLDFSEAMRTLATRAGIEIASRGQAADTANARLLEASEAAAAFFQHVFVNAAEAEPARDYAGRRGLNSEALEAFQIGFAPERWSALTSHLQERSFTTAELVEAGLSIEGDRGLHDRFRGRLIFPIRDGRHRVVGFGGRSLGDGLPKYLNSPQSAIFDKSGLLYALDRAVDAIRKDGEAVIVEGYLDAITAHQFGYQNVVATLGTALTERHVALLKRYTTKVALALDADAAGIEAATRGEQLIREVAAGERAEVVVGGGRDWRSLVHVQTRAPLDVRIFSVPSGKDPDEAIRADPEGWKAWVEGAMPPFEFRLRHELERLDRDSPRERLALVDRMAPLLAEVGDRTLQAQYLSQLATSLGVREDHVRLRLNELVPANRRGQQVVYLEPARAPTPAQRIPGERMENFCLALLLRLEDSRAAGMELSPEQFISTPNRELFELWRDDPALNEEAIPEALQPHWRELQSLRIMPSVAADAPSALDECLKRMELLRLEDRKRLSTAALAASRPAANAAVDEDASASAGILSLQEQVQVDLEIGRDLHRLEQTLRTGRAWRRPPIVHGEAEEAGARGNDG